MEAGRVVAGGGRRQPASCAMRSMRIREATPTSRWLVIRGTAPQNPQQGRDLHGGLSAPASRCCWCCATLLDDA